MRGGAPLTWLKPLTPEGTRAPGIMGCYRGHFEHWNFESVRPGYVIRGVHKKRVQSRQRQGWKIATLEDARPFGGVPEGLQTGLGGAALETENLVFMIAPVEVAQKRLDHLSAMNKQWTSRDNPGTTQYLNRTAGGEDVYRSHESRPIRFVDEFSGGFGPDQ